MTQPHPTPALPRAPAWDITFTRLALAARPRMEAWALALGRRFQAMGLRTEAQVRQSPRGLSTILALVGERGLICIVDLTLVDGMAAGQGPSAALDIRLLDACGDVVVEGLAACLAGCMPRCTAGPMADGIAGRNSLEMVVAQALMGDNLDRAATAVVVAALGHFELLRTVARHG